MERGPKYLQSCEKRALDIVLGGGGLLVSMPIIGVLAIAKYIEDGEPPFFFQERVSNDGKKFKIVKIRSMVNGGEPDEIRVTKLGRWLRKTHMDELPQFALVLSGQMSLVGPRPISEKSFDGVLEKVSSERFEEMECDYISSNSGLTGAWQLLGENGQNHAMFHPNRFYLKNASLLLDLKIIYKTAKKVLKSLK